MNHLGDSERSIQSIESTSAYKGNTRFLMLTIKMLIAKGILPAILTHLLKYSVFFGSWHWQTLRRLC